MRKLIGILAITAATLALAAPVASATEIGNTCVANAGGGSQTAVQLSKAASDPAPIAAPADGVITGWKVNVVTFSGTANVKLKVFRPTDNPNVFTVVHESGISAVNGGPTSFSDRFPIKAGDRIGMTGIGSPGLLYCFASASDIAGVVAGDPALDSQPTFTPTPSFKPAISATFEADVDGDGFGDETEDKCPRSKALQTACPTIALNSISVAMKSSLLLFVTSTSTTPVTATATVKVPKKASKKAKTSATRTVKFAPVSQTIEPNKISSFTLKFPKALNAALAKLPAKKSVKVTVTATATDATGLVTNSVTTAKVRGTAPSAPK